ncbi:MAG: alpha/beta fold hydrolase [Pyrinomonadaceae bacterium]|nr:alpha/beta fold hydrolase [Phycisphaerales bacterium]
MPTGAASQIGLRASLQRFRWLLLYIALLAGSYVYISVAPSRVAMNRVTEGVPPNAVAEIPAMGDDGPVHGRTMRLAYIDTPADGRGRWAPGDPMDRGDMQRLPIVLIHGSPGSASGFDKLTPLLAKAGYRVIAVDLPGFGGSSKDVPSLSVKAHARAVIALLDSLHVERAHILGWSLGGGVVLHMADMIPDRVASMTMLAASGPQETEGSRSYFFEHFKYRAGLVLFSGLPLIPHFGLLGDPSDSEMCWSLRNFDDTDMRPLPGIMRRLTTPTMILHGRRDFLVPEWAAARHHELIRPSRLVMIDALHFLPFMQQQETAGQMLAFVGLHDKPGVKAHRFTATFAPPRAHAMGLVGRWAEWALRVSPWWVVSFGFAALSLRKPGLAVAIAAMIVSQIKVDFAVCVSGLLAGRLVTPVLCWVLASREDRIQRIFRQRALVSPVDWARRFEQQAPGFRLGLRCVLRPDLRLVAPRAMRLLRGGALNTALFATGIVVMTGILIFLQFVPGLVLAGLLGSYFRLDYAVSSFPGWMLRFVLLWLSFGVVWLYVGAVPLMMTWTGRRILLARVRRLVSPEFWPGWVFYAPLSPYYAYLMFKTGHMVRFTACNPGIKPGGGVIGESKFDIQSELDASSGLVLPTVRIDMHQSAAVRARAAIEIMLQERSLGGYPVIIKPDVGHRGFAVRLIRAEREFEPYFQEMTRPAVVQAYHPGPLEVGILWSRRLDTLYSAPTGGEGTTGFIYSITRKDFPSLTGDGKHTFEQLIYRDRRLRCQADVFLERFADDASRVIPLGETRRLAQSGNHCQGTLFRDGADLITPQLTKAIDRLASSFAATTPGGPGLLDIGRFDVRFAGEGDLKAGRNFAVLELNGTASESTNVYDPGKSIFWTYKTLYGLWRLLFELGAWRAGMGVPTMPVGVLLRSLRKFYKTRTGSSLAD